MTDRIDSNKLLMAAVAVLLSVLAYFGQRAVEGQDELRRAVLELGGEIRELRVRLEADAEAIDRLEDRISELERRSNDG